MKTKMNIKMKLHKNQKLTVLKFLKNFHNKSMNDMSLKKHHYKNKKQLQKTKGYRQFEKVNIVQNLNLPNQ